MKNIIKRVPTPLSGVMLGVSALGNLLQSYGENIRYVCGIFAAFLLILIILKLCMFFDDVKEDMKNPIMASVSGTFPMALMLLSTYIKPFVGSLAFYIWIFAILLHVILIIYFTMKFIVHFDIKKVFASYYIVYVGIVVASVTAPAYNNLFIGTICFWFGLITLIILFVVVTIRYTKYKEIPDPARPLICIYAAPVSLCTVGYVQSITPKSYEFLMVLFIVSSIIYIFALTQFVKYVRKGFFPSFASFTFPFVISAIAIKQTNACATKLGHTMSLQPFILIETIIAVVLVVFVYYKFMEFIFIKK